MRLRGEGEACTLSFVIGGLIAGGGRGRRGQREEEMRSEGGRLRW